MRMKELSCALVLALAMTCTAFGQNNTQDATQLKKAEIVKLLETTQALALSRQMAGLFVAQMTQGIQTNRPDIPKTALDFLPSTVDEVMKDNESFFRDLFVALYDQHFSLSDIQGINSFYDSPVGKKMLEKQSLLVQQSATIGAEWGRRVGPEIDRRVKTKLAAQGYKL